MGLGDFMKTPFVQKNFMKWLEKPQGVPTPQSPNQEGSHPHEFRFSEAVKLISTLPGLHYFRKDDRDKLDVSVMSLKEERTSEIITPIETETVANTNEQEIAECVSPAIADTAANTSPVANTEPTVETKIEVCKIDIALQKDDVPRVDRGDSTRSNPALQSEAISVDIDDKIPKRKKSRRSGGKEKDRKKSSRPSRVHISRMCLDVVVSGPMYMVTDNFNNLKIKKVVTIAGAGISTAANIPDFRSPESGLYKKLEKYKLPNPQCVFERKFFDKNPKPLFALLKEILQYDYRPTIAHHFLRLLEDKGVLLRHFTQNVDGLERLAGVSSEKIVEAHGTIYHSKCTKCKAEYDLGWLRNQLFVLSNSVPYCEVRNCKGIVKPDIVLFGEPLGSRFTSCASKDIPDCDLLIIMGTSLIVEPFATIVKHVSKTCVRIIINNTAVGEHLGIVYEGSKRFQRSIRKNSWRDVFIQGTCDDGVVHIAKLLRWNRDLERLIERSKQQNNAKTSKDQNLGSTTHERHRKSGHTEDVIKKDDNSKQCKADGLEMKKSTKYRFENDRGRNENVETRAHCSVASFASQQPSNLSKLWKCWTSQVWKRKE